MATGDCRRLRYGNVYDVSATTETTATNEIRCKFSDVAFELMCRQTNSVKWYFVDSLPAINQVTKVYIEIVQSNASEYNIFDVEKDLFTRTSSLESLTISNSNLPNVHQLNLRKCPWLKKFNGSHNAIISLRGFSFWGTKLELLDLSFNKIAFIDNDAFNVKSFGVEQISSVSDEKPHTGLELTALYLHNNRLTAVKSEWFENLRNLTILTLNDNFIREFDGYTVLTNNKLLSNLRIDNNLLASIENLSVENLPELTEVDVSSNVHLGKSGVIINLSVLKMNNISIIECHVKPSTLNIHANNNNISALVIHSPKGNENILTELHLAYNKMTDLKNITLLPHLQWLDLSHNLIESVETKTFQGLTELTHLNLDNNLIRKLAPNCFDGLSNLQFLNFSSNKLNEFLAEFSGTNLQDLDISANALTTINTNIKRKATQLKRINIADNLWECGQLSDTLLFLLMDDINVFSPDAISESWESNVRGIGCNKTTAIVDDSELIDPAEADQLRHEIETMLDEKINNFERRITDLIIKIHLDAKKTKN